MEGRSVGREVRKEGRIKGVARREVKTNKGRKSRQRNGDLGEEGE